MDLRDGFRKGTIDLLAPDLYPLEVGNSLVMAARSARIPAQKLALVYADLMTNLPIIYPSLSLFPRAYEIACQARVSVYDALYVALAEREGCKLVTADEKLIQILVGFPTISLASYRSLGGFGVDWKSTLRFLRRFQT